MIQKKIFFWASEYSSNSGEGKLAKKFINDFYNEHQVLIKSSDKLNIKNKYLSPFVGLFYVWKYYINGFKVGYINYLPLWNFLIFIMMPPNTILGPITGGSIYNNNDKLNFLIRKFLFPIFYKISEILLFIRFKKMIFSTDLLKKNLSKKTISNSEFNYVLKNFYYKKKKIKDIDLIIYYRKYRNKKDLLDTNFIIRQLNQKKKIFVIGDKLNLKNVYNIGYVSNKQIDIYQSRSKYTLFTGENIYSFFIIECMQNHVKIFIKKKFYKNLSFKKKKFIPY